MVSYLRTADSMNEAFGSMQKGGFRIVTVADTVNRLVVGDTIWQLWTILPRDPIQSANDDTSRFYLPWRHVYGPIDYSYAATFKISIWHFDCEFREPLNNNGNIFFADIVGLTENNTPKIQNNVIYNNIFNELVLPPYDTSFHGLEPFNNPALGSCRDSLIYRYCENNEKWIGDPSPWEIEATSRRDLLE